jgi:hypothetical protein
MKLKGKHKPFSEYFSLLISFAGITSKNKHKKQKISSIEYEKWQWIELSQRCIEDKLLVGDESDFSLDSLDVGEVWSKQQKRNKSFYFL